METAESYTTQENPDQIEDASNDHAYFCMMPNMLDDLLDPYQYRLYAHYKRVCGESGACWQSTETTAKACRMSTGKVSQVKRELHEMGLIRVEERKRKHGGLPYHYIVIMDIWKENFVHCATPSSPYERPSSPGEYASSPGETKKTPLEEDPSEEGKEPPLADSPPADDSYISAVHSLPPPESTVSDPDTPDINDLYGRAARAVAPSVVTEEPAPPDSPLDDSLDDTPLPRMPAPRTTVQTRLRMRGGPTSVYVEKSGDAPADATLWPNDRDAPNNDKMSAETFRANHAHTVEGLQQETVEARAAAPHPDMTDARMDFRPSCDAPVVAWCRIAKKDYAGLSDGARIKLGSIFYEVAVVMESTPSQVAEAIDRFPIEHEWWAKEVGFEWPSENFCNKLGMMLVPDIEPDPPPTFTFVEPDWLGVAT